MALKCRRDEGVSAGPLTMLQEDNTGRHSLLLGSSSSSKCEAQVCKTAPP